MRRGPGGGGACTRPPHALSHTTARQQRHMFGTGRVHAEQSPFISDQCRNLNSAYDMSGSSASPAARSRPATRNNPVWWRSGSRCVSAPDPAQCRCSAGFTIEKAFCTFCSSATHAAPRTGAGLVHAEERWEGTWSEGPCWRETERLGETQNSPRL